MLIDFYAAEQLLIKTRQAQTVSQINDLGASVAEGMPFVFAPVASPDMASNQDASPLRAAERSESGFMMQGARQGAESQYLRRIEAQTMKLSDELLNDNRASNDVKLKKQRENKKDVLSDLFNSENYRKGSVPDRTGYQAYLMDWLRDDTETSVLTFDDWKASQ